MTASIGRFEYEARRRRAWRALYDASVEVHVRKRDWNSVEDDKRFDRALSAQYDATKELVKLARFEEQARKAKTRS